MKILVLLEVFLLFSQDSAAIFLPNNLPFFGTDGDDRVRANRFETENVREPNRPVLDRFLEPLLGDNQATAFVTEQIHAIGDQINRGVDFLHDTDHGLRICNRDSPTNQGVCYAGATCSDLNGFTIGECSSPTPINKCCKFERTCGESSKETVTYFRSPQNFPDGFTGACTFEARARPNTCQMRVDFIDFVFDDPTGGVCPTASQLSVINSEESGGFGKGVSTFCGTNTGNHFYIHIKRSNQPIQFRVTETAGNVRRRPFNIRITQVFCRSGLDEMKELKAPAGCLQYFFETAGALSSFNYATTDVVGPNQKYSICFRSESPVCALTLRQRRFGLPIVTECVGMMGMAPPVAAAVMGVQTICCAGSSVTVTDALDSSGTSLGREKFCGRLVRPNPTMATEDGVFGDGTGRVVTEEKPLVVRVDTGAAAGTPADDTAMPPTLGDVGFLLEYELVEICS